jgi:Tfp pilus assembly protein PilF
MPFPRRPAWETGLILLLLCGLAAGCSAPGSAVTRLSRWGAAPGGSPDEDTDEADVQPARLSAEQLLTAHAKSIDATLGLARLDQIGGRNTEAEAGFKRAVRLDNNSGRTLDALGRLYVDQKRWADAVAALHKASIVAPDDKTVRFDYAMALARSGQISEAMPVLRTTVSPAEVHFHIGVVYFEQGDLAASEEQFSQALREDPQLQSARQWLGEVRRQREQEHARAPRSDPSATAAVWEPGKNRK